MICYSHPFSTKRTLKKTSSSKLTLHTISLSSKWPSDKPPLRVRAPILDHAQQKRLIASLWLIFARCAPHRGWCPTSCQVQCFEPHVSITFYPPVVVSMFWTINTKLATAFSVCSYELRAFASSASWILDSVSWVSSTSTNSQYFWKPNRILSSEAGVESFFGINN